MISEMPDLIPIILIGLLGSVHCMGMCGGFALAVAQASGNGRPFLIRQSLYYLGKTFTYAMLGGIAGGLGQVIGGMFAGMQQALSVGLGAFLIFIGLGLLGWLKRFSGSGIIRWWKPLTDAIGQRLRKNTKAATFGLGLLNGLLPCGLVYGALALAAASGHAAKGALLMAVFGLATIPALFLIAAFGALMNPVWRNRLNQVSGVVMIALGAITIMRGFPGGHEMDHGADAAMHHDIDAKPVRVVRERPRRRTSHIEHRMFITS